MLVASLVVACESNDLKPVPLVEPDRLYWELELNQHAVTLSTTSPYDTVRLIAVPRNHRGEALAGLPAPHFTSTDIEHVLVTPEGLLVAVAPNDNFHLTAVVATLMVDDLRHTDTVLVRITSDTAPPVLANFSIHPVPPDSAKVAAQGGGFSPCLHVRARAFDPAGSPIPDLPVYYRSSDTTVASTSAQGYVTWGGDLDCVVVGLQPGMINLYATISAFGVTKSDTLPVRIGWPIAARVNIVPAAIGQSANTFVEGEVRLAGGGLVVWSAGTTKTPTEVTFNDPSNVAAVNTEPHLFDEADLPPGFLLLWCTYVWQADCTVGGNFAASAGKQIAAARVFPVPGTYDYQASTGARARIIVVDER